MPPPLSASAAPPVDKKLMWILTGYAWLIIASGFFLLCTLPFRH